MKTRSPYLALIGLLAACSTPTADNDPLTALINTPIPAHSSETPQQIQVPASAGPDTLAALAIEHNPKLNALRQRAIRLAQKAPQAESLPDPTANIALGSLPETAAGKVDAVLGVQQKVPFPGKRTSTALAHREQALAAQAEAKAYQARLAEHVHHAYWDHYLANISLRINRESKEIIQSLQQSVDAQVATNQSTQTDQLQISNELTELDRDLARARQLRNTARARLNSLMNRPAGAPLPELKSPPPQSLGQLNQLLATAEKNHPEIQSARHRASAFVHKLKRAKLERYPDITLGIQVAPVGSSGLAPSANGRDQIYGTIGVNIPLWQEPRRAMLREAQAGLEETQSELGSARADLRYQVEEAYYSAQNGQEIATLFQDRLIPEAQQAYEISLTSYAAGNAPLERVIDAWQTWLSYQLQHAKNRAQIGKAMATLQAATSHH